MPTIYFGVPVLPELYNIHRESFCRMAKTLLLLVEEYIDKLADYVCTSDDRAHRTAEVGKYNDQ